MSDKLTTAEAAEILNISAITLHRYRSKGKPFIPYYQIQRRVWYKKSDLQTFLDQQKHIYPPV